MSVKFILFDAFGTLLRIPQGRHPYRMILKEGIRQGRRPQPNDLRQVMTRSLSLEEAAELFGIIIRPDLMAEIQGALDADLSSIEPFDDGLFHAVFATTLLVQSLTHRSLDSSITEAHG
ncbi:hypothetical protein [Pseudomonas sp. WS 5413]|uniref:hypothetical protein n=1 Tax=Pseudomonas sp. WS 5413 TaxID=2717488 RepID=UPI0021CC6848|nr:hypothetical protein [Pseudomonas sp. WS 5413]